MGWRNGGLVPLLLFLGASIQMETAFGSSPSKSPLEEKDCIVQRATRGHPVSHAGSRAMLHVDDTAELLVQTFRIKVGGDSLVFRFSGKKPNRSVLYDVSLGDSLGQVSLKLAEWHELEVSPSHLTLGRKRLPVSTKVLDTGKGLQFEVEDEKQGIELRFCENGCVHVKTPPSNDVYLIQPLRESRALWVWARGKDTEATIHLSIKRDQSVSKDFLRFVVQEKETWILVRVDVSGENVELQDMTSGKRVRWAVATRGGDVSFYFESEKEMYWSFGCGASDESSMWLIILCSGIAVCSFIMVITICLLIYRRVSSSPPTHPETEGPGFESIFIASPRCSQDDGGSGTGRNILAHGTPPAAPDQAARGEAARQGGSGEGLQTADESRSRSKCPTPVNQVAGPTGTQSQEEEPRETKGNNTCSSWKSHEEGKVAVNGVENENRGREQSRIPRRRDGHQNRKSKRRAAEQGPRTPSHATKHTSPDTTPQVQEGPQSSRLKKIDRIPSEIIRELSTNQTFSQKDTSPSAPRNTLEKEPQGTKHRERAKQKKEISPRKGQSDTKALKPSRSGHALAKQENPLHTEYGSGLIMHGTSTKNLAVGHANMGLQGPLPKGVFQQQGSIVVVARGPPGYVHQHPMYTSHCPPTGHRQNHRPVTTLPGNYRNRSRIHQPASDLEIRRVMSHNGINEAAHLAYAPPTPAPMLLAPSQTLTIPHQHHSPSRTSPRLVPCYSPIVLGPGVRSQGHGLSATPSPRPRGGRRAQEAGGAEELYDQLASDSE